MSNKFIFGSVGRRCFLRIIGGIFAVTAVIFLIKILLNKDGMKKIQESA